MGNGCQGEEPFPDFYYLSLSPSIPEPAFDAPDEQGRVWGRMWGSFDEVGPLRGSGARGRCATRPMSLGTITARFP